MKKQINPTIKAHLIRGAFYLLLLVAVCAIPFALAQSRSRGTTNPGVIKPTVLPHLHSIKPTIPATYAVPSNPDFAPPAVIGEQLSSLPADGAVALASGVTDASEVNNLGAPLFPEGGCGTPGPWSTATPGPPARYRAGSATDGQYVYVYGGGNSSGGYYNDLWRWNPVTEIWTQLANIPARILPRTPSTISLPTPGVLARLYQRPKRELTWLSITRSTISVATLARKTL